MSNWLANLTIYQCPTCQKDTIFKSGCTDCDALETAKQDFQDLTNEYKENVKLLKELNAKQATIVIELIRLDDKINYGGKNG